MNSESIQSGPEAVVTSWLSGVRLGAPGAFGGLAVFPVYHDHPSSKVGYVTLADGLASGAVVVAEQPRASVPTLKVENRGTQPVLILDGEEVVGGLQNRVINLTVLVGPESVLDLPVSCVEHGRWSGSTPVFDSGESAYPTLRRLKMEQVGAAVVAEAAPRSDQGAIWNEIATRHRRERVASPTGALRDAYVRRATELADAERRLPCPEDSPVGVVATVGGRAHCVDLFDAPTTLRAYWPRLVRSYALEAVEATLEPPSADSAQRLLRRPLLARCSAHRSPGLGVDVRIVGNGVVGAALVLDSTVIHTALFRQRGAGQADGGIRRPGSRARRHAERQATEGY